MGNLLEKPITEKHTHYEKSKTMPGVSYAVSSMQGWRFSMEDSHVHQLNLNTNGSDPSSPLSDISIFSVFDGHGGDAIARVSAEIMVDTFRKTIEKVEIEDHNEKMKEAMKDTFLGMDRKMKELPRIMSGEDRSGCTAVSAILSRDAFVVANAGDSRCIIVGENGSVRFASEDHKPYNPEETQRILAAGGYVAMQRVNGDLAVSRGLGDYVYKRNGSLPDELQQVSPLPDVNIIQRLPTDLFLVLACDGIWDVMSNEDCAKYLFDAIQDGFSIEQCAENLIDYCLELGSQDNMSVIIVSLPAVSNIPRSKAFYSVTSDEENENTMQEEKGEPKTSTETQSNEDELSKSLASESNTTEKADSSLTPPRKTQSKNKSKRRQSNNGNKTKRNIQSSPE